MKKSTKNRVRRIFQRRVASLWPRSKIRFRFFGRRVYIYAGDVPSRREYSGAVGLSLKKKDWRHLRHDITVAPLPIPSGIVDLFQSEDVFEHIQLEQLPAVVKEIARTLKPGGIFRLSVPDYRSDILLKRVQRDESGAIVFDPGGQGYLEDGVVKGGGHVWFPVFETVDSLLREGSFSAVTFYHYFDPDGQPRVEPIDYQNGFVARTPDHDSRVQNPRRPLSIVVDCKK